MSNPETKAASEKKYQAGIKSKEDGIRKGISLKNKYMKMLSAAEKWNSPTSSHDSFKEFMCKQIRDSIDFDCDISYYEEQKIVLLTGHDWKEEELSQFLKDIDYHTKNNCEEIARASKNTLWIKNLRESLV